MEETTSLAQVPRRCDFCDESIDVPWKCTSCDTVLCLRCGRRHTVESDHRIINLSNPGQGPLLKIARCNIHKHYDIYNFCRGCDSPICAKCLVESHQGHCIEEIEKVYGEKIRRLEEFHNTLSSDFLLKISSERNELEKLNFLHQQHLEREKQKIINRDKIIKDQTTSHTNKLLEELENNSKDIDSKIQNLKSKMDKQILELENKLSFIQENQNNIDLETVCNINKDVKCFIENLDSTPNSLPRESFQFLHGTTLDIEQMLGSLQKCYVKKLVDFETIQSYNSDLQVIGSIAVSKIDNTVWIRNFREDIVKKIELAEQAKTLLEIKQMKVNNIATTPEGELLITEAGVPCIKKVDQLGQLTDFYVFPKKMFKNVQIPLGLHVTNDGQVIVSSVEKGGDKYNVSKNSHRQVEVMSLACENIHVFELDAEGERRFSWPRKITSTTSGDICVIDWTDYDNGRLIVLDRSGAFKWIYAGNPYNTTRLFQPNDAVSMSNTFFVISSAENAIHVLNNDGQITKYFQTVELGFDRPCSVEIDHKEQLLVGNKKGQIFVLYVTGC